MSDTGLVTVDKKVGSKDDLKIIHGKRLESDSSFVKGNNTFFNPTSFSGLQCGRSVYYFNHCREELVIGERAGFQRIISPLHNIHFRGLVVKVCYETSSNVKTDFHDLAYSKNENDLILADALGSPSSGTGLNVVNMYYVFDEEELFDEEGKTVYIKELDIVIGRVRDASTMAMHPYFSEGMYGHYVDSLPKQINNSSGVNFALIDSTKTMRERFINFNGIIIKVTAQHDSEMSDGLYIYADSVANGELDSKQLYNHYTIEEMETKLSATVFNSYEKAVHQGSPQHTREVEKLKAELKLEAKKLAAKESEIEFKEQELERSRKKEKFDEELESLRKEKELLRQQKLFEVKDNYERRSYERKDSNESLKTIGAIIGAVGTLGLLYKKVVMDGK